VVWLYAGELERIPREVQAHLEAHELQISPAVVLDLQYARALWGKKRR
jgi:hypothetical protein